MCEMMRAFVRNKVDALCPRTPFFSVPSQALANYAVAYFHEQPYSDHYVLKVTKIREDSFMLEYFVK
jgi:hypothetical protein